MIYYLHYPNNQISPPYLVHITPVKNILYILLGIYFLVIASFDLVPLIAIISALVVDKPGSLATCCTIA